MIFGNPDLFGICVEPIEAWSTEEIKNGVMCFVLQNRIIGGNLFRSTLGPELIRMKSIIPSLREGKREISSEWSAADAFAHLKNLSFPETEGDEYRSHVISTWSLMDAGIDVFHEVLSDKDERILYSEGEGKPIGELILPLNTVLDVFQSAVAEMEATLKDSEGREGA